MTNPSDNNRRNFINKSLLWSTGILTTVISYPLFQFTSHTVKPKPRPIEIKTPLKAEGYYIHHDFILFTDNGEPKAYSRICTHLGCRVTYREELKIIECPCHQSKFTPQGIRIAGPAKRGLVSLPVETKLDNEGDITGYVVVL